MKLVKVLHLANADQTISLFMRPQLKRLQELGYEVHVVCPEGINKDNILREGYVAHFMKITREISPLRDLFLLIALWRLYTKEKYMIIHAHSAKLEIIGQLAGWLARIPIILYTNHGLLFRSHTSSFKHRLFRLLAKISGRISHHIFSQSREDMDFALALNVYPQKKLSYLGNGIDITAFNPARFTAELIAQKKTELGISTSAKVIGMVARFVDEKGYPELIEAAKEIVKRRHDVHFLCVGNKMINERDPVDFSTLDKNGLKSHFTILESRSDMPELYAAMDMVILPSHREGFPRTLIEAAAMAKPVIATDISGCREAVIHMKNGLLIPLKEPTTLAENISVLLNDALLMDQLGRTGRDMAVAFFDERSVVRRLETEYKRLLALHHHV